MKSEELGFLAYTFASVRIEPAVTFRDVLHEAVT